MSFHARTVALKPQSGDPSVYWVAILQHDKRPEDVEDALDYLWIKATGKITVKTCRDQYEKRHNKIGRVYLKHSSSSAIALDETPLRDLDHSRDRVIEFEAILLGDLGARLPQARAPLQQLSQNAKLSPQPASFEEPPPNVNPSAKIKSEHASIQKHQLNAYASARSPPASSDTSSDCSEDNLSLLHTRKDLPSAAVTSEPKAKDGTMDAASIIEHTKSQNPQFARYLEQNQARILQENPDSKLYNAAWLEWSHLDPSSRAQYYTKVDVSAGQPYESPYSHDDGAVSDDDAPQEEHDDAPKKFQLQSLVADASIDLLEWSVERGVKLLDQLRAPLESKMEFSPDAAQWVEQIERLRKSAVKTKTIIGVVGNTGAGKSSVINAMLDEERLLPTNCMRACTACPTQILYNHGEIPYRAEIEFIEIADWEKDLNILFEDLLDGSGNVSKDCANQDTDAGVAYAKIKAVYPSKTKEDLANSSVPSLLREVKHLLGQTRKVEDTDSLMFYKHLQSYVDSKEKSTGEKDKDKNKKPEPKTREMWPLIKLVSIYIRAPALETGACIVDLPGTLDSSAARNVVAQNFMKQCTGLWIVAPINRAVDDKTAKTLLGDSFKRQLKLDGGFSTVSFICSKCDDISLVEAQDSLGLDAQMAPRWTEIDELDQKRKDLENELGQLKEIKETYGKSMFESDEQLEVWEVLKDDAQEGKVVYSPLSASRKRKNNKASECRQKRQRLNDDEGDADYLDESEEEEKSEQSEDEQTPDLGAPLSLETINQRITEIRDAKKEARRERIEIDHKMKDIRAQLQKAKEAVKEIEGDLEHLCISGRNEYSSKAIQQDYAAGIKELDQELAAEEDEANFNPEEDVRDYDEVARSLPVFCVSSRGYQKLQGRFKKDPPVRGFKTVAETQIPQLQEHCKQLTVSGRTTSCKRFLTNLSQLLNSISLWASNDENGYKMMPEQRALETRVLHGNLQKLENGLEQLVADITKDLKFEIENNIYEEYDGAIAAAKEEAGKTAARWGGPVNRDDRPAGGYYWSTYKAICRRNGIYSNAQGPHDWNQSLSEPMMKIIIPGWERTFTRRVTHVLNSLPTKATGLMQKFHKDVDVRARRIGAGLASLHMLQQQLQVFVDVFKDLAITTVEKIKVRQREVNRLFVPMIEDALADVYHTCTIESGAGQYLRMKAAMTREVDLKRNFMFKSATDNVRQQLNEMLRAIDEDMSNRADEVFVAMRRDYRSILGGEEVPQGEVMPKWAKDMRKEIMRLIDGVEEHFTRIANAEEELLKDGEGDTLDLEDDLAANSTSGPKEPASEIVSVTSNAPDPEANTSTNSIAEDSNAITNSAHHVKPEADTTDNLDHIEEHGANQHGEHDDAAAQLHRDMEMADAQPARCQAPQVEDSQSSSSRSSTPQNELSTAKEDGANGTNDEDFMEDFDVASSAMAILDW